MADIYMTTHCDAQGAGNSALADCGGCHLPLGILGKEEVELLLCDLDHILGPQGMRGILGCQQGAMQSDPILSQHMQLPLPCRARLNQHLGSQEADSY